MKFDRVLTIVKYVYSAIAVVALLWTAASFDGRKAAALFWAVTAGVFILTWTTLWQRRRG